MRRATSSQSPFKRKRRQLAFEPLEDRLTPAQFMAGIVGAPVESPEGTVLTLTSTVTPANSGDVIDVASYAWSVTKDGAAYATGTDANFTFTPDDNGAYAVSLTITDTAGDTSTATASTTGTNVAPTATVTGPAALVPGQTATFTLNATDPSTVDQTAGFTFGLDWNGDGTVDQTVTGPSGTQVTHVFSGTGTNNVSVTATDKDGGVSAPATLSVGVKTVALEPDPANPGKTALFVAGTAGNDNIQFTPGGKSGVRVRVNGVDQGSFAPTGSLVVLAGDGDDNIQVAGSIRTAARLYGEGGNDRIKAGKGASLLDGGDGNDELIGGHANDILIGGGGADRLVGGPGEDILIAGSTASKGDDAALGQLLNTWAGTGNYSTRVAAMAATLTAGITEDGVADKLTGAAGLDWYVTTDPLDQITGLTKGEVVNAPSTGGGTGGGTGGHGNGNGSSHGNGNGHGNGHNK